MWGVCGVMPLIPRVVEVACNEQWSSRRPQPLIWRSQVEVGSRHREELATDLADGTVSHGLLLWRSWSTFALINI